jgi:rod shape-determining protein MreC
MARKQIRAWVPGRDKAPWGSLSAGMLLTWCMLTGLILFFTPQSLTGRLQFAFARIFRIPLSISRNISLSVRTQQPLGDVVSRKEYNQLQNHLANVTEELFEKHKKLEKLSRLRNRLYGLENARLMPADVITSVIDGSHGELIINRGADDGLAKDQFVLGNNSIIGTVSEVDARTACVKLLTDPASKLAVELTDSKVHRLMYGSGGNIAKVRQLQLKHKISVGDVVKAAKKPGLLDTPMITGKVAQCKRDEQNPSLWDVTVKPACDIESLKEVAVIIMNP